MQMVRTLCLAAVPNTFRYAASVPAQSATTTYDTYNLATQQPDRAKTVHTAPYIVR